jgi:hypothetical protein
VEVELILGLMMRGVCRVIPHTDLMMISLNMACLESGWSDKKRIILTAGNRRDIEQIGASLTTTNDVLCGELCRRPILIWK